MINPNTKKEYTEVELLKMISEDVGRLSKIEFFLHPNEEDYPIYTKLEHIEVSLADMRGALFSIKKIMIWVVCLLAGILLFSVFK